MRSFFLIFSFLLLISLSSQCGMLTHNEISQRALFSFKNPAFSSNDYLSFLKLNQGYLQAASAYPDWGYLCKSPAGEASHWPPFLEAFKNYIRSNYKISEESAHLMVFLMGVTSHDEADVIWHWGRQETGSDQQGFLHSMSHDSSFCRDEWNEGTNPTCHSIGDTGGDFFLAYRGGLDWLNDLWHVPTEDLSKVYSTMGMNISSLEIGGCMAVMFTGAILEKIGAGLIFQYFGKHSAFLSEELDLWYAGGIDDMAINVQWKWNQVIAELEGKQGIHEGKEKIKRDFPDIFKFEKEIMEKYAGLLGLKIEKNEKNGHSFSLGKINKNKYDTILSELEKDILNKLNLKKIEEPIKSVISDIKSIFRNSPSKTYESSHSYSYFSKDITSGNYNGNTTEIFVSAPGYSLSGKTQIGAIYKLNSIIDYENPFLIEDIEYSRCGFSMQTIDINHDGYDDLIVSCPSFGNGGPSNLTDYYPKVYNGKIKIYLGRPEIGIRKGDPDFEISSKENESFKNFGFNLFKSDCDGDGFDDLLIGSPFSQALGDQRGVIHLINGVKLNYSNITTKIFVEDIALFIEKGTEDYQWFGYSAVCYNKKLYIGSPGKRMDHKNQAAGSVFIFEINKEENKFNLIHQIRSNFSQAKFGISISINKENEFLAVGASSLATDNGNNFHAGGVYIYNVKKFNDSLIDIDNYESFIKCSSNSARFGKEIQWLGNDLFVSAPQFTDSINLHKERGIIYRYNNAFNLKNEINFNEYNEYWEGEEGGARFGSKIHFIKNNMIVAMPWKFNGKNRLAGGIATFEIKMQNTE